MPHVGFGRNRQPSVDKIEFVERRVKTSRLAMADSVPIGSFVMARRWIVIDILVILLFVGIGRANHHHGDNLSGMASTTWPFAVGLSIGWLIVLARRQNGVSLGAGVEIWLSTVTLGMILRVIAGQGTAFAFVVVALGFLGALMLGLRLVRSRLVTRST
jgi:hypothetical protein